MVKTEMRAEIDRIQSAWLLKEKEWERERGQRGSCGEGESGREGGREREREGERSRGLAGELQEMERATSSRS